MAKRSKKKKMPPEDKASQVIVAEPKSGLPSEALASLAPIKQKIGVIPLKQPWWQRDEFRAALLIFAIVLAYQQVWHAGTIWDDDQHMIGPELRSWSGLEQIWFQPGATQQYYPVVYGVFWLESHLWGDAPLGYHLVNVLLQCLSALLVVKLLRQLEIPGAWLGAALWALHPVQVESVAWISELKNMLSGACYLGSALAYLRFDRKREGQFYWLALVLFVAGLLAKTVIATLPAALLLVFWWKRKNLRWNADVLPLVPFFIAGIGLGLFTAWVEVTYVMGRITSDFSFSLMERCLIAGRDIWFYLGKLAWPHPLIFIYPRWEISAAVWWQYLFPAAALLLAAGLWRFRHRIGDGPLVAFLFFVGTLFPALGFFDVYPFRYSFVADHFQYLASLGPLVLAGAGIALALRPLDQRGSLPTIIVSATLLLTLGSLTWMQCRTYADLETLWRATVAKNPGGWLAHNNLGNVLVHSGQYAEAIKESEIASRLNPGDAEVQANFGNVLLHAGRVSEAIQQFEAALRINPEEAKVHNTLGTALIRLGRFPEAIDQYKTAIRIAPNFTEAYNNLGVVLLQTGQVSDAIQEFQTALQIDRNYAEAHNNLGDALLHAGQISEAIEECALSVKLQPDVAQAHYNLANGLFMYKRFPEAIEQYDDAIKIKPDYAHAHLNLGNALQQTGQLSQAMEQYEQALRIEPDLADAKANLAKLQALQKSAPPQNK